MPGLSPLAALVHREILLGDLARPQEGVLVAVSGGADSLALAGLLGEIADAGLLRPPAIAHLDHGWRGATEARADAEVVDRFARARGLAVHRAGPPPAPVPSEDAARRWRYATLAGLARRLGATRIATGHHRRDQAETVLLRLARRSGRHGLRGIEPCRPLAGHGVAVVRPLLDLDPRALRAWLLARGARWREDVTNDDASRDRTRARRDLLRAGTRREIRLSRFAARVRRRFLGREHEVSFRLAGRRRPRPFAGATEVDRAALLALGPRLFETALRTWGRDVAADRDGPYLTARHISLARRAFLDAGAVDLPHSLALRVGSRRAFFYRRAGWDGAPLPRLVREETTGAFDLARFLRSRHPHEAVFDGDRLGEGHRLRRARPDDRFRPRGAASAATRPLFPWLARQGAPSWLRPRLLVVAGPDAVAWVPGYREAAGLEVGATTRRVVRLALAPPAVEPPARIESVPR